MTKPEREYQSGLKKRIKKLIPDCTIIKSDPAQIQGVPDLLILHGKRWALLEVKRSQNAKHRPNQDYYVNKFNKEGFASFIYPENESEVLEKMTKYLRCQNDLE